MAQETCDISIFIFFSFFMFLVLWSFKQDAETLFW
jgi:predicted lipid carrier protein YhbT